MTNGQPGLRVSRQSLRIARNCWNEGVGENYYQQYILKKKFVWSYQLSAGAGSFFLGPATVTFIIPARAVIAAVYCVSIARHFVGQTSTQQLHTMQRSRSICQVFSLTSTQIAWVGHFRWQDRHVIQPSGLIVTCPRVRCVFFAGFAGYIRVAGWENRFFITVFVISK